MNLGDLRVFPEETAWLRRVEDLIRRVDQRGVWVRTDFLTPRERMIAEAAARHAGLVTAAWGGHADAERQRLLLMPDDWQPALEDFEIDILLVTAAGGEPLRHGAVLGSVLGTGVDRRRVGDIAVDGARAWLAVCKGTSDFLLGELRRVGRHVVQVERLPVCPDQGQDSADKPVEAGLRWPAVVWETAEISVPSLRLDAVVAHACRWSRKQAQESISSGAVAVNHVPITDLDHEVTTGDLLSVRGFGRVRLEDVLGTTRKERWRVRVGIIRSQG